MNQTKNHPKITYQAALKFLTSLIPKLEGKFPAQLGIDRTLYLMERLNNPQNKLKIIHVAGTSGKGSTSYMLSTILHQHGFKVGLTVSPYLLDLRERIQINNQLIDKETFAKATAEIMPIIKEMEKLAIGKPSYFEAVVALTFLIFAWEKTDYAVVEVGLGGTYDATNIISRKDKLCIITRIGLDHTEILGKTLVKIAAQKAGIITNKNTVITLKQTLGINKVFKKKAAEAKAKLIFLENKRDYFVREKQGRVELNLKLTSNKTKKLKFILGMQGKYQGENTALAVRAARFLAKRDAWKFDLYQTGTALLKSNFAGRFELIPGINGELIIDGAHNPQKMKAFIGSLQARYPKQKFHFLMAFKRDKDQRSMLKLVLPLAKSLTFTSFVHEQHFLIYSQEPAELKTMVDDLGFRGTVNLEPDLEKAVKHISELADSAPKIITGSLYLLSDVYPLIKK